MENKINLVEILKDCPKGMELDCMIWDNVVFDEVDFEDPNYPIGVRIKNGAIKWLTADGKYDLTNDAKCVIFPKGKTTWEGFVPPCKFKCGDVVYTSLGNIALLTDKQSDESFSICCILIGGTFETTESFVRPLRLATEEEKQKLFDAIKDNGYKWNEETKTLEELYHYPKTLYECCAILGLTELGIIGGYRSGLLTQFRNLLICRDAYWKIAGDWKPDWLNAEQDKHVIFTHNNAICSNRYVLGHYILAFPTEEMRDAFFENFKELINECKSLL